MTSTVSTDDLINPISYTTPGIGPTTAGLGLPTYSPFNSAADGSWTPTYDPILGGFGYPGASILAPQLQNQFFFPSTDIGVWSQDPFNSWLISSAPVPLDQTQIAAGTGLGLDGSTLGTNLDPMGSIGQSFSGMSLNGSLHSLVPALNAPTIIPGTPDTVGAVAISPAIIPPQPEKPKTWAAIASQPAKPKLVPPKPPALSNETENDKKTQGQFSRGNQSGLITAAFVTGAGNAQAGRGPRKNGTKPVITSTTTGTGKGVPDVVSKLQSENNYNPSELTLNLNNARYFVIKSYAEDDVHRSIKYNVWCSTDHGNRRLDNAFREQKAKGGVVYLFFSVNGSGHFCGVAQMMSEVELNTEVGIWTQDKWKGRFDVKWIYVKDVPNNQLRHIRLENNENKPVTNSRDTQEVPPEKGKMVIKVIHQYQHTTSIFDDFEHYEKRQEEDTATTTTTPTSTSTAISGSSKKVHLNTQHW